MGPSNINGLEIFRNSILDPSHSFEAPSPLLILERAGAEIPIYTSGSISAIIGKAKSRKTRFCVLLAGALISGRVSGDGFSFVSKLQKGDKILWFDTEQGKHYASRTQKQILKMIEESSSSQLVFSDLRAHSTSERLAAIVEGINNTVNLKVVVIDGIRDLMQDFNNVSDSTDLLNTLMKLTQEKNIHIVCVLHQNKGDTNARGHLGTELVNKCEIAISVHKINSATSVVKADFTRGIDFESFYISENAHGEPCLLGLNGKTDSSHNINKAVIPEAASHDQKQAIKNFLKEGGEGVYTKTQIDDLLEDALQEVFGTTSRDAKARWLKFLLPDVIEQTGTPGTRAVRYRISN